MHKMELIGEKEFWEVQKQFKVLNGVESKSAENFLPFMELN